LVLNQKQYTTEFTPDEDGDWEFSLFVASRGNLFIDGKLVIDLSTEGSKPSEDIFFRTGSEDVHVTLKGLKAGQKLSLDLRLSNIELAKKPTLTENWGGFRMGGMCVVEDETGIKKAVNLAKSSDGILSLLCYALLTLTRTFKLSFW
jgi:beta-glucosidase